MSAFNSLALEQVPDFRGTMMSLSQVSQNAGQAIGTALSGVILVVYDYEFLSILGGFAIIAAIIFQFLTVDPVTTQKPTLRNEE